ncbi:hypothetical protein J4E91_006557 [Alternaria rosae]|nr:hypothetical protein J4E91_006557 [Alternaria rosae]
MESREPPTECSSSNDYIDETQLSFDKLEAQRWERALKSSQRALDQSMDSFCNYSAPMLNHSLQETQDSSESTMRGGRGGSAFQSPASDTTVKLSNGYKALEHSSAYTFFRTPYTVAATSETGATNGSASSDSEISPFSQHQSFADDAVDSTLQTRLGGPIQTPAREGIHETRDIWSSPTQMQNQESEGSARFRLSLNTATFGSAALLQSSFPIPRNMPFEEMIVPRGPNLHQRRLDARVSSSPSIPSPLGPGHMREQLHEGDVGGVSLSPLPTGRLPTSDQMKYGNSKSSDSDMKNVWQNTPSPHSPTVQRYASSGSMDSPIFDVYPRSAEIDDAGNLILGGSPNVVCGATLPIPSPSKNRMNGTPTPFIPPSQSFTRPPRTSFTGTWPTSAPATSRFATPAETEGPRSARETGFQARLPLRENLPIPPPPLSSIEDQCEQTPEARARLDAQKPIREAWIREEASKIAQLARLRHAMEKRYQETRSDKDYEAWQNLQAAYDDATNLEKRQEERRNLLLENKKMKALKTDSVEDMSLASRDSAGVDGEEKLLGYKMALMERTCAEVKPDEDAEAITAEMLETLSKEEKKAIRKLLITRLGRKP